MIQERSCKYCNNNFDISEKPKGWMANHTRWCFQNPKRSDYIGIVRSQYASSGINSAKSIEKRSESIKKAHVDGKYDSAHIKGLNTKRERGNNLHTEKTKEKMRISALASPHRRLRKKIINYKGTQLDSQWELYLAERLDCLGIEWYRPSPIKWADLSGAEHNYFPDFFLPDYNLYLDPKNPYAFKVQEEKITCLIKQYSNILFIRTEEECKNFTI